MNELQTAYQTEIDNTLKPLLSTTIGFFFRGRVGTRTGVLRLYSIRCSDVELHLEANTKTGTTLITHKLLLPAKCWYDQENSRAVFNYNIAEMFADASCIQSARQYISANKPSRYIDESLYIQPYDQNAKTK